MTEDRITALERGQAEIFKVLKELNGNVHELISFQRDIERHGLDIRSIQERSREYDKLTTKVAYLDEKVERLQWRADKTEEKLEAEGKESNKRIKIIENALPNLTLASNWVFKGVLALIAFGSVADPILRMFGK